MRIGFGYDVHQLVEGRKLILGGIEIPYEKTGFESYIYENCRVLDKEYDNNIIKIKSRCNYRIFNKLVSMTSKEEYKNTVISKIEGNEG